MADTASVPSEGSGKRVTQPVDVGAMLGGRYKITGQVLVSADSDYVFDGVDQILSRKVSILVPAQDHAEDMAHHARQVAVGERTDPLQILDLGRVDGHRYLVTNRASAPELLDVLLSEDPPIAGDDDGAPYDIDHDDRYRLLPDTPNDQSDDDRAFESELLAGSTSDLESQEPEAERARSRWGFGRRTSGASAGGTAEDRGSGAGTAPVVGSAYGADTVDTTSFDAIDDDDSHDEGAWRDDENADRVSLGAQTHDDALPVDDQEDDIDRHDRAATVAGATAAGAAAGGVQNHEFGGEPSTNEDRIGDPVENDDDGMDDDDDDDRENDPRFSRALILLLAAVLVVGAVMFVFTQLGQLGRGSESASRETPVATASASPTASSSATASSTPSANPQPVIAGVTREMKNNQYEGIAQLDRLLPRLYDGNEATDWFSATYSNADFAGLADNLALVFELRDATKVSRVDITQRGGSGGSFQVMVNDQPTIDGARQVAQGSFTSPEVSVALPANTPAGKYLIINFTELPRINGGQYPYGIRIGEIALS